MKNDAVLNTNQELEVEEDKKTEEKKEEVLKYNLK